MNTELRMDAIGSTLLEQSCTEHGSCNDDDSFNQSVSYGDDDFLLFLPPPPRSVLHTFAHVP
jgi:hypothetical protein